MPAGHMHLGANEVVVWAWSLDAPPAELPPLEGLLSPQERARSKRFVRDVDGGRFVVAHGRLRQFLGWATGKDPASIGFVTGAHGKPELSDAAVQFSLSHSGPVAAAAVAFFPIGIDIEMLDSVNLRVADMYFSPAERTGLRNLPAASVSPAFLRCWTRKEALLKACGTGLAAPLDSFSVSFLPHEPPRVTWVADDPTGPDEWEICHLDLGPSCLGAVAARRKGWGVRGWSDGPAAGTNLLAT